MSTDKGTVEAALFSAGKPLEIEEIAEKTKLPVDEVTTLLAKLRKDYDRVESALEIARIGKKWTMQIRVDYTDRARSFAPPKLPDDVLKTAALIAYHQPVRQSDLGDMIGDKVYEHVRMLRDMNLVTTKPEGRTLSLTTSRSFPVFFGLKETSRTDIKRMMAERAGIRTQNENASTQEPHDTA